MIKKINDKYALVSKTGKPLAYYKGEGKPSEEWVAKEEARIKYFKHKLGEEYSESLEEIYTPLLEIIHPNMMGIAELFRFNLAATSEQKAQHKQHLMNRDYQSAWNLVSNVLNIGKIDANIYKPDPNKIDIATAAGSSNAGSNKESSKFNNPFESLDTFTDFINSIIVEELHPELKNIVSDNSYNRASKQTRLVKKIKELSSRGEHTGIEGNMPKGSSRAFLFEESPRDITLDDKPAKLSVGTKVAITSDLDRYHDKAQFGNKSLGELQEEIENDDSYVNNYHRVLTQEENGNYTTNENGIFPPLVEHDPNHKFSVVGQCANLTQSLFKKITKTPEYPKGISHADFCEALEREHEQNLGRYWEKEPEEETRLNHILDHPLVQKFAKYHNDSGVMPYDYRQLKNLGVFTHPINGEQSIVARDHGFNHVCAEAYQKAHKKRMDKENEKIINNWRGFNPFVNS